MSYTVEKRFITDVDRDGTVKYSKQLVENLKECSIAMIDLHYEKGLDRVKIQKIDDFGQVVKEAKYYIGEVYSRSFVTKGTNVYDILYKYYKRDPLLVLEKGDKVIITYKNTFNIVSEDDIKHENVHVIDIKDLENLKYKKGGYECI